MNSFGQSPKPDQEDEPARVNLSPEQIRRLEEELRTYYARISTIRRLLELDPEYSEFQAWKKGTRNLRQNLARLLAWGVAFFVLLVFFNRLLRP